jgi:hypothetical protein
MRYDGTKVLVLGGIQTAPYLASYLSKQVEVLECK